MNHNNDKLPTGKISKRKVHLSFSSKTLLFEADRDQYRKPHLNTI